MAVNKDCLHYLLPGAVGGSETEERCRVDANETEPFACPEGCLFYDFGANPRPWETEVRTRDRQAAGGRTPEGGRR
ncbi:MAG: hypothetical protein ACRDX8_02085 [Acidimicrobiales bacterium]